MASLSLSVFLLLAFTHTAAIVADAMITTTNAATAMATKIVRSLPRRGGLKGVLIVDCVAVRVGTGVPLGVEGVGVTGMAAPDKEFVQWSERAVCHCVWAVQKDTNFVILI